MNEWKPAKPVDHISEAGDTLRAGGVCGDGGVGILPVGGAGDRIGGPDLRDCGPLPWSNRVRLSTLQLLTQGTLFVRPRV